MREEIRKGIEDCLRFRVAAIEEVENPHGYQLVPEAVVEIVADIVQFLHSKDVVRKVKGELPDHLMEGQVACNKDTYAAMLEHAGYTLTTEEL